MSGRIQDVKRILKVRKHRHWQLFALFLIPLLYILIFKYGPMYGAQIAFKDFRAVQGIWNSEWAGFRHFIRFFKSAAFDTVMINTIGISIYQLLAGFPFPIILALSLNTIRHARYKKTIQLVTYAPYFISTVVMVGLILQFLDPRGGLLNQAITLIGGEPKNLLSNPALFKSIYVWSGVWQTAGFGSIIYLAALASVDPQMHEAAVIDGATLFQRVIHIDLPGIMPTAVILLILSTGSVLDVGFEKIFLMQNPLNMRSSEVISTYVYKVGLASPTTNYSYPTAIGLFQSVVGLILLLGVNRAAKKLGKSSLW